MGFKLKILELENFVVFVDRTSIDFSDSAINFIEAVYKQNSEQSNGAGKSVLICAISLALFGKGIRFNHINDYIAPTNPTGGIYIGLTLEREDGTLVKVERWKRPGSDTTKAKLWINGTCVSTGATVSKVDELISSHVGVTHTNFLSCVFTVMLPGFLKLRPAQRFEILENALAVKKIDSLIKKLNTSLKQISDQLNGTNDALIEKKAEYGQEQAKQEIYKANTDALAASIKDHTTDLDKYKNTEASLLKMQSDISAIMQQALTKKNKAQALSTALTAKLLSLNEQHSKVNTSLTTITRALKKTDSHIECVICKSKLDPSSETELVDHYKTELLTISTSRNELQAELSEVQAKISSIDSKIEEIRNKKDAVEAELRINYASMMSCDKAIQQATTTIEQAKSSFNDAKLQQLLTEVNNLSSQKKTLQKDQLIYEGWKAAMAKNGLRLAYLREEVSTLSAIATKFATSVYNTPTKVEFYISDEKDNPQLEFTVNGKFASAFSTGESRMLEITMTLSLITLLKTAGMNLDFVILDEALDGLSVASKKNMISIIDDIAADNQVVMISHDAMLKNHDGHIIQVTKDSATETSTLDVFDREAQS